MKSTTSKSSERVVGGLIFAPSKETRAKLTKEGYTVHVGLNAFYASPATGPAIVYDYAGALVDQGIPILDAVYRDGVYHHCHLKKPQAILVKPEAITSGPAVPLKVEEMDVLHDKGVRMVSEEAYSKATGHNKMSRGAGHRVAKKK